MKWILVLIFLSGCASQKPNTDQMRHLAWLDGSRETEYRSNKEIAVEKLKKYGAEGPSTGDVEAYLEYVSFLDAAGRTDDARKKIYVLLEKNSNEPRAVFLLAVSALRKNQKDLAKYYFQKLEKDDGFVWRSLVLNNLGMIAINDEDRNLAIQYFEGAIKEKPTLAAPLVNLGAIYLESHHYEKAKSIFEDAASLDPNFEDAHLGLGVSYAGLGNYDKAHSVFEGYLSDHSNALALLYNDAILLANHLNQKDKARAQMMQHIKLGGKQTANAQKLIRTWR